MLKALCDRLPEKPDLYLDEMAVFLWDELYMQVTGCSISRALTSIGWLTSAWQKPKERNQGWRDSYIQEYSTGVAKYYCSSKVRSPVGYIKRN